MSSQPRCPACNSAMVARVRRRLLNRFISFFGLFPYICRSCSHRFRARRARQQLATSIR